MSEPVGIGAYPKADLPDTAATGAGSIVFVTDDVGGPILTFNDVWK